MSRIKSDERVIFFPTFARLSEDGESWLVPIHGWIFEPEEGDVLRSALADELVDDFGLDPKQASTPIFRDRLALFLVDNERGKRIQIQIGDQTHVLPKSAADGHFLGTLRLDAKWVQRFATDGVLTFQATASDSRRFAGVCHCLDPEGITVISDIDDTIKVTEVLDKRRLILNTFFREFRAVDGMATVYRRWADAGADFHLVSASPWQLYEPLAVFARAAGFPPASLHLKRVRLKDSTIKRLFEDPVAFKVTAIETVVKAFPKRKFVLVGDSGEKDPEAYGIIARQHGAQILRIYVRDLTGDKVDGERYQEAFREVPATKWQLFRKPSEIDDFG